MAYNNYFPTTYPAYYYQPNYQQSVPQLQQQPNVNVGQQIPQTSGIIWVQGEAGAKSYLVAPNTTVQLWDSENQVIYLKSADASGMPSIKTLDYTIRELPQNTSNLAQNDTSTPFNASEQLNTLMDEIKALRGDFDAFLKKSAKKKEVSDE